MMAHVDRRTMLVVDPSLQSRSVLLELFADKEVLLASDAEEAIRILADHSDCKVVIVDVSLAAHSGFEFLYELRTYADWSDVSVIVYSSVDLQRDILKSRAWQQLQIAAYFYKPKALLRELHKVVSGLLEVSA